MIHAHTYNFTCSHIYVTCSHIYVYDTYHIFICVWRQPGKPSLNCEACMLVLKYLLMHPPLLVKSWRTRLYYYSSGRSTFQLIAKDLKEWFDCSEDGGRRLRQVHVYNLHILTQNLHILYVYDIRACSCKKSARTANWPSSTDQEKQWTGRESALSSPYCPSRVLIAPWNVVSPSETHLQTSQTRSEIHVPHMLDFGTYMLLRRDYIL